MSNAAAESPAPVQGPLAGLTVVDLTRVLAGPYCTMVLADLGARIIKVEPPRSGDDSRAYGPFANGVSAYFASLNRSKESIALDLKKEADQAIFEKLLERADVLVENYRPGTMEKLGYGWETLHAKYPRLIYAAASGFGHTGPYSRRAAYDMVVQAMGGIMSVTGNPGQPPVRVGTSIGDITAGLFTAVGVNAALYHRTMTGEAIKVDVAMLDCQVAILENAIARYAATGEVAGPIGARHPSISPFAAFRARDGHVVIAAGNDALFARMCEAIGTPWLATDPRFATNALRCQNWQPLFMEIEKALAADSVAGWLDALDRAGVPTGPINTVDKVLADAHVRSRNMVVTTESKETGRLEMAGNPIKMSSFPDPATRRPAPALDADRSHILKEIMAPSPGVPAIRAASGLTSTLPTVRRSAGRLLDYLRQAIGVDVNPRDMLAGTFRERAKALADALISERGEVLGTVLADELVHLVKSASGAERFELFELLASAYAQDPRRVQVAADRWRADPNPANYARLMEAVEPPRQELFRRMNMAPGGTSVLVALRGDLIRQLRDHRSLAPVDQDLRHLFGSWFNRGFLRLERISWHTPAVVLEKLIAYEAVHEIDGWEDLRRRLASDRRCYAFFHPALPDEPLIFVEVALLDRLADRIEPIIRAPLPPEDDERETTTAVFYSISNCQPGLKGISFGNLLIKQVAADLQSELPDIDTFATLSPIPGFRAWLDNPSTAVAEHLPRSVGERIMKETGESSVANGLARLAHQGEADGYSRSDLLRQALLHLCARYLAGIGSKTGPTDPVARFHLGNGARIEQLNWMGDLSQKGIRQGHGLMVNYLYDLDQVEKNHEAFANTRPVAVSKDIAELIDIAEVDLLPQALKSGVDAAKGLLVRKT